MLNTKKLKIISWSLVTIVLTLAIIVWVGERIDGGKLKLYDIFPLLGLGAFSIMWTHYIAGSARRYLNLQARDNKDYLKWTSTVVLILILLHPGLLIYQLYKDGFGLPPQSYFAVYALPAMKTAIMLGTISLIIFLAYELRKKFYKKSWWKFINWAQIVAMILVFYHGLTLGRELSVGWYKAVWFLYGMCFVGAVYYNYWYDKKARLNK